MEATSNSADQSESASEHSRPAVNLKGSGGLQVAVWRNKSEQGFENYSVRIERTYRDGRDGPFKTTQNLRDSDLLRAAKLLEEAINGLNLRNQSTGPRMQAEVKRRNPKTAV